jgi:hypothetical protein
MACGPDDRRLFYEKKIMAIKITLEINLVYPWSPQPCTRYKQILMWVSSTLCERGGTNWEGAAVILSSNRPR